MAEVSRRAVLKAGNLRGGQASAGSIQSAILTVNNQLAADIIIKTILLPSGNIIGRRLKVQRSIPPNSRKFH